MSILNNPTCRDCANLRGYIPIRPLNAAAEGFCANCGQKKGVTNANLWKLKAEPKRVK